ISLVVTVPCAAGGAGEDVLLTGALHTLISLTVNNGGGVSGVMHFQPQGLSGIGMTTGSKYQGTGVTQTKFSANVGEQMTFVNNFRIIGQGPGNNFLVHEVAHVTFNANGTVTASFDNLSIDCK